MSKKKKNRNRPYRQTAPGATAQRAAEAGAAVPQDRLQQAEATGGTLVTDYRGFHIEVTSDDLDDYEAMSKLTQSVPGPFLEIVFPDERERARFLRECCSDENGKVRFTLAVQAAMEIFEALGMGN